MNMIYQKKNIMTFTYGPSGLYGTLGARGRLARGHFFILASLRWVTRGCWCIATQLLFKIYLIKLRLAWAGSIGLKPRPHRKLM